MNYYNRMDMYSEYIIKHKKNTKDYLIIVGYILLGVILSLLSLMLTMLFKYPLFGIAFLLIACIWYGVYVFSATRNVEYEYIFTNGEMDIDKIIAKRGRKRVLSINFKEIERCACIHDPKFKHEYENDSQRKVYDFSSGKETEQVYFVDYRTEEGTKRMLIEPPEKMIEQIRQTNPNAVFIME
jgi:hypothetical protein